MSCARNKRKLVGSKMTHNKHYLFRLEHHLPKSKRKLLGLSETEAYYCILRAHGWSNKQAQALTKRLSNQEVNSEKIMRGINEVCETLFEKRKVELEQKIFGILYDRAFYNIGDVINTDGTLKYEDWEDFPDSVRNAIDGVQLQPFRDADGKRAMNINFANRERALVLLGQYLANLKPNQAKEFNNGDAMKLLEKFNEVQVAVDAEIVK